MTALPPYLSAPAIGSLVTVPADRKPCYSGCGCYRNRGYVGIVVSVQRDVRSGRVLSVGAQWYDAEWTHVTTEPVSVSHVAPWSPPVR